jgi:hypothetical protein
VDKKKELKEEIARLNNELEKVAASELPLAIREEQPPLVVDLPEGQKLVVGKIEEGTVIEVASWRGTGRPDSRTSRLMLGLTRDDEDEEITEAKRKFLRGNRKGIEKQAEVLSADIHENGGQQLAVENSRPSASVRTGVDFELIKPTTSTSENKNRKSIGKSVVPTSKKKGNVMGEFFKRNKGVMITLVAIVVLILGVLFPGGVSIARPVAGSAISMGKVSDALVAYKRGKHVVVGDKIIVKLPKGQPSPELVIVQAVSKQSILTNAGGKLLPVSPSDVQGRVLALFPYLGWPFS